MKEERRYRGVQANIKQLLDDAANDSSPYGIANLGRAILAAELYVRNEQAHARYQAHVDLLAAVEWRISGMPAEREGKS